MATEEQMLATSVKFTTASGVDYQLPRLTIRTRRAALDFVAEAEAIQALGFGNAESASALLDKLVDLLEAWLAKICPGITRDQIEDDWDAEDIPGLMRLIADWEEGIKALCPPAPTVPKRTAKKRN